MPTLRFSYKRSKFECQSTWLLSTKRPDDFVGVDGPIPVSVQESETRQPLCSHGRPHIGLNPPHSTKKRSGVAVDTGIVTMMVRMAVTLGCSSLLVEQSVWCRVVGLFSGSTCAHFAFHRTISSSNTVLSVKSGSYMLKILFVVSGVSRWIFLGIMYCLRNLSCCFSIRSLSSSNNNTTRVETLLSRNAEPNNKFEELRALPRIFSPSSVLTFGTDIT